MKTPKEENNQKNKTEIILIYNISGLSGVVQILLKNRRRFDQIFGPYQNERYISNHLFSSTQ